MSLTKPIENIINIKFDSIIDDLIKETKINKTDIYNFIKKEHNFIKINKTDSKSSDLIKDKLLYFLNNDTKFLHFNKTLLDIVKNLKLYAQKKKLDDSYITEDYVNNILISFLNHNI